jgi:hypothetical protein
MAECYRGESPDRITAHRKVRTNAASRRRVRQRGRAERRAMRSPDRTTDKNGMARVIAVVLFFFFFFFIEAQAQTDDWDNLSNTPGRLIGLLDLPDILAGCGPAPDHATTRAFATPSQNGRTVGTIYRGDEDDVGCALMIQKAQGIKERVLTLESGYEIPAAIVFERRGPWFRIRLKEGSAWIRRTDPKDFLSFPEILRDKLAHTMQTWDGTLRATPGPSGRITPLSPGWKALIDRQLGFEYLGSRRVGNDIWLRIRLAAKGPCGQTYENVSDVEGWIPAYHADRTPLAWFSSRGC